MTNVELARMHLSGDRVTVGLATCGISAGAEPVYRALAEAGFAIPVDRVGCAGMCYNEPVVTVTQKGRHYIYGPVTKEKVTSLIECIREGRVYKELLLGRSLQQIPFYKKQKRLVMANCGKIDPQDLAQYIAEGGYEGLKKAVALGQKGVIGEVRASGLRGRGGAGFPTWKKWSFIAGAKGAKYLIANGDEGDPGAFMNRTLMESDPFRILEGMAIGAVATGAREGFIYTRAEYPLAIQTLKKAIDAAYENNLLGKNILGSGHSFDLEIRKGAGAFVCGEETALIASIEGRRGSPRPRPPYPAQKGLYSLPTSVNNIGTWAHVATILGIGASQYARTGTRKTPGTKIVCLTGKVKRTGVAEVPMGTTVRDIVYKIGGGLPRGVRFKGALTGGPAGGCIPWEKIKARLDFEEMQELGSIMGSGGLVVIGGDQCIVDIARFFMNFTQEESCGKCTPCREGTKRLLEMLERISQGKKASLAKLTQLAQFVQENSLCGLGQNAPNPVLSTLRWFMPEYLEHVEKGYCRAGQCTGLVKYFITKKCIGCTKCAQSCPVKCIAGEQGKLHVIDQERCIRCGTCYEVCPIKAIVKK